MSAKTFSKPFALIKTGTNARGQSGYGHVPFVEVYAIPDWLKGDTYITATLTPIEARKLAIGLLVAADSADEAKETP